MSKIEFWHDGDSSVGIGGDNATIDIDLTYLEEEQVNDIVASFKEILEDIWDFYVSSHVIIEEEPDTSIY